MDADSTQGQEGDHGHEDGGHSHGDEDHSHE
jgi:hypothetical protein